MRSLSPSPWERHPVSGHGLGSRDRKVYTGHRRPAGPLGGYPVRSLRVWTSPVSAQHRRDATPLDSTCKSDVTLFSEAAALTFSLVGIPGLVVHNYHAVEHLACTVAKAINLTSTVLALLSHELGEVRQGMLQNRLAVDYLLLRHGHLCQEFAGMCCFNVTDAGPSVEADLLRLRKLAEGIHQQQGDAWLWS
ncbi:unnamed protein product [Natator depressus]